MCMYRFNRNMAAKSDISRDEYLHMMFLLSQMDGDMIGNGGNTPEKHHLSERILPHLIKSILNYNKHDCTTWKSEMHALSTCVNSNTSALQYVLKYSNLIEFIFDMLPKFATKDFAPLSRGPDPDGCECIARALCTISMFVTGSKSDQKMWEYYTRNFKLSELNQRGGGYFSFVSSLYEKIAINLLRFHDCKIKYKSIAGRRGKKMTSVLGSDRKHPASRLEDMVLSISGMQYRVFCSYPKCGKKADRDLFAGKCGSCRLTRYCSKQCQIDHWTQGDHKKNCLKVLPREF